MMSKPIYIVILTGLFVFVFFFFFFFFFFERSGRRAWHFYSFFSVNVLARVDFLV